MRKFLFVLAFCAVLFGAIDLNAQVRPSLVGLGMTYNLRAIDNENGIITLGSFGLSGDVFRGSSFGIYSGFDIDVILGGESDEIDLDSYRVKYCASALFAVAGKIDLTGDIGLIAGAGIGLDHVFLDFSDESSVTYSGPCLYVGPGVVVLGKFRIDDGLSIYASLRAQYNVVAIVDSSLWDDEPRFGFKNGIAIIPTIGAMFGN
jgi:hypothetical protein